MRAWNRIPWVTLESDVSRRLRPQLAAHRRAVEAAHNALRAVVFMAAAVPAQKGATARAVQSKLLVRISNDLRLIELACVRGYVLQAMSLAATMHELTHVTAFIGDDDAKAREWEAHKQLTDTFPSLRQRRSTLRTSLAALGFQGVDLEDEIQNQENNYRLFCAAKHGNPVLHRDWGRVSADGSEHVIHGPFYEDRSPEQVRNVLYACVRLAWFACGVYAFPWYANAPKPERERFRRKLRWLEELLWRARFAPHEGPPPRASSAAPRHAKSRR